VLYQTLRRTGVFLPLVLLALSFALSDRTVENIGDNVQIALPLAGLACAASGGTGARYVGRYVLMTAIFTATKRSLGDAPINIRPTGGGQGFPSAHTSAASFGATGLISTCLKENPTAQAVAILAAGFVGGSRIEARKHTIWQVMAGAILGWALQVAALGTIDRAARRLWDGTRRSVGGGIGRLRGTSEKTPPED